VARTASDVMLSCATLRFPSKGKDKCDTHRMLAPPTQAAKARRPPTSPPVQHGASLGPRGQDVVRRHSLGGQDRSASTPILPRGALIPRRAAAPLIRHPTSYIPLSAQIGSAAKT
jgi:hypothetical protein